MATNAQLPYLRPLGYDCTISFRPAFPVQAVANLTGPIEGDKEKKNPSLCASELDRSILGRGSNSSHDAVRERGNI